MWKVLLFKRNFSRHICFLFQFEILTSSLLDVPKGHGTTNTTTTQYTSILTNDMIKVQSYVTFTVFFIGAIKDYGQTKCWIVCCYSVNRVSERNFPLLCKKNEKKMKNCYSSVLSLKLVDSNCFSDENAFQFSTVFHLSYLIHISEMDGKSVQTVIFIVVHRLEKNGEKPKK